MKVRLLLLAVLAILMLITCAEASPGYYVNNSCTSGCDGLTPETGWPTIQQCANNVTAGDTCYVINTGTPYIGKTTISKGGNATHRVSFVGLNYPQIDCINGTYTAPNCCFVFSQGADYITVEGFDIHSNRTAFYTYYEKGVHDYLIIRNNIINTTYPVSGVFPNNAIAISLETNHSIIHNNTIITSRKGIVFGWSNTQAINNTVTNNWVWGGFGLTEDDKGRCKLC